MLLACLYGGSNSGSVIPRLTTEQNAKRLQRNTCEDAAEVFGALLNTFCQVTHNCIKTLGESLVDVGLSRVSQQDCVDNDCVYGPYTVDAPYPLFQNHRVPREVEVDEVTRNLEIDPFPTSRTRHEYPSA